VFGESRAPRGGPRRTLATPIIMRLPAWRHRLTLCCNPMLQGTLCAIAKHALVGMPGNNSCQTACPQSLTSAFGLSTCLHSYLPVSTAPHSGSAVLICNTCDSCSPSGSHDPLLQRVPAQEQVLQGCFSTQLRDAIDAHPRSPSLSTCLLADPCRCPDGLFRIQTLLAPPHQPML
jgi:hypothetical protein